MALYTTAEITAEIAAWKGALTALATAKSYTVSSGGMTRTVTRENLPEIRAHLEWLEQQQAKASGTGGRPVVIIGRPAR